MLTQEVLDRLGRPYNPKSGKDLAARNRLYKQAALQLGVPYRQNGGQDDHNNLIDRLDFYYPGWRGYPNPKVCLVEVA